MHRSPDDGIGGVQVLGRGRPRQPGNVGQVPEEAFTALRVPFIVLKYECASIARMNGRPHPIHLLVLGAVVLRGLGEFVSLQRWRLREWRLR